MIYRHYHVALLGDALLVFGFILLTVLDNPRFPFFTDGCMDLD